MAVLLIAFVFGFLFFGFGEGSTGTGGGPTSHPPRHVNCKARMGTGESRRDCGGPPANP